MVKADTVYNLIKSQLETFGISNSAFEAAQIISFIKDVDRSKFAFEDMTSEEQLQALSLAARRKKGEPLQYILGGWDFLGNKIFCREGVLIPRPETEVLALKAIEIIKANNYKSVLDLCCGNGCIGLSAAKYTKANVTMADISDKALKLANENADLWQVKTEIKKMDALISFDESYDVILCNPPYIKTCEIDTLQTEVKDYEPHLALDGGEDGLIFYRTIAYNASKAGAKMLMFEIGINQQKPVFDIMQLNGYKDIQTVNDLENIPRVIFGFLK